MALWWFQVPFTGNSISIAQFLELSWFYISTQSIFFFGAVYFRGNNFLKTVLSIFLLFLVNSIYQALLGSLAFREIIVLLIQQHTLEDLVTAPGLEEYMEANFLPFLKIVFYYVIPVFFLSLSYIRIKEREV